MARVGADSTAPAADNGNTSLLYAPYAQASNINVEERNHASSAVAFEDERYEADPETEAVVANPFFDDGSVGGEVEGGDEDNDDEDMWGDGKDSSEEDIVAGYSDYDRDSRKEMEDVSTAGCDDDGTAVLSSIPRSADHREQDDGEFLDINSGEEGDQMARIEEEVGLNEATLESLHAKYTAIKAEIDGERDAWWILMEQWRKEVVAFWDSTSIPASVTLKSSSRRAFIIARAEAHRIRLTDLGSRRGQLQKSQETNAALVRTVEGTMRRCVDRLRRKVDEAKSRSKDLVGDDSIYDADADPAEIKVDPLDRSDDGHGVEKSPQEYRPPSAESSRPSVGSSSLAVTTSHRSQIALAIPSSEPLPLFQESQAILEENTLQSSQNAVETETRIHAVHENEYLLNKLWLGNTCEGSKEKKSEMNEGRLSSASLPFLLPPIPYASILDKIIDVAHGEISENRNMKGKDRLGDDEDIAESMMRGTCLDVFANVSCQVIEKLDYFGTGDINTPKAEGDGDLLNRDSGVARIDVTAVLCPYELSGECADGSCPYQHLDSHNVVSRRGVTVAMTTLPKLKLPPTPTHPDTVEKDTFENSKTKVAQIHGDSPSKKSRQHAPNIPMVPGTKAMAGNKRKLREEAECVVTEVTTEMSKDDVEGPDYRCSVEAKQPMYGTKENIYTEGEVVIKSSSLCDKVGQESDVIGTSVEGEVDPFLVAALSSNKKGDDEIEFDAENKDDEWEVQADYIAIPDLLITESINDDDQSAFITDIRADDNSSISSSEGTSDSHDESKGPAEVSGLKNHNRHDSQAIFWHTPISQCSRIFSLLKSRDGSLRLLDIMNLLGLEVKMDREGKREQSAESKSHARVLNPKVFTSLCFVDLRPPSSGIVALQDLVAVARVVDSVRLSVHAGRFDIAYAALKLGKARCAASLAANRSEWKFSQEILVDVLSFLQLIIDDAYHGTGTFAMASFCGQMSLSLLATYIESFYHQAAEGDDNYSCNLSFGDCADELKWRKLLEDVKALYSMLKENGIKNEHEITLEQEHLSTLRSIFAAGITQGEGAVDEKKWVRKLHKAIRNAFDYIWRATTLFSSSDSPSIKSLGMRFYLHTRRILHCVRLGLVLADCVAVFARNSAHLGLGSIGHLVLEPVWSEVRHNLSTRCGQSRNKSSLRIHRSSVDSSNVRSNLPLLAVALVGPAFLSSVSATLSIVLADFRESDNVSQLPLPSNWDARSQGSLSELSRVLAKTVKQMQHLGSDRSRHHHLDHGMASSLLFVPLIALGASISTGMGLYVKAQLTLEAALCSSFNSEDHWIPENILDHDLMIGRAQDCWLVYSELLWSQLLHLRMMFPAKEQSSGDITKLDIDTKKKGKGEKSISHSLSFSDESVDHLLTRRVIEYGVNPQHISSLGDAVLTHQILSGHNFALNDGKCVPEKEFSTSNEQAAPTNIRNICRTIVEKLFESGMMNTNNRIMDERSCEQNNCSAPFKEVKERTESTSTIMLNGISLHERDYFAAPHMNQISEPRTLSIFPLSILLLGETISCLHLRKCGLCSLPATLGKYLTNLKDLDIAENKLSHLPQSICLMGQLRTLDVTSNNLLLLPKSIGNLVDLLRLNVSNNCIKELPQSLVKCVKLEVLDLRHNFLHSLSSEVPLKLSNLHTLLLDGNPIDNN